MRLTRALVPLALAGALLAGCGDSNQDSEGSGTPTTAPASNGVADLTPDEIVDKAAAALDAAKSYRMQGDINDEGQTMTLDFKVAGEDVLGSISMQGAKVELLSAAGQFYIRPDAAFWKQNAGDGAENIAKLMAGRWAKLSPKDEDFKGFFQLADPHQLLKPDGTLTKGQTKDVNGVSAIGLVDGSADGGTLYVATTGEPYPLLLEGPKGEGQISFSDFGATFADVKAPAPNEVVDLDKLLQGG